VLRPVRLGLLLLLRCWLHWRLQVGGRQHSSI
jgi:hypothetical protein